MIWDISGREASGIGGGGPFGAVLLGRDGRLGLLFPNPSCLASCIVGADGGGGRFLRAGRLGLESRDAAFVVVGTPDGRRGGGLGRTDGEGTGGGLEPDRLSLEVNLEDNPPRLLLLLSVGRGIGSKLASFGRRGGNLGNSVSPHAGAFMRLLLMESTEVVDPPRPAVVAVDPVECDAVDVVEP